MHLACINTNVNSISKNNWLCHSCYEISPFNHIEDDIEHQNILNNVTCTNHCIKSIGELEKTVFKPFDSDINSESQFMDLDPDVQYFNTSNGFN